MYVVVTSLKFHFLLYFLADILAELNALNLKFQRRQVHVTQVLRMVDNTILILRSRYVTYDSQFGPTSGDFFEFLQLHAGGKDVTISGTDANDTPLIHTYQLHERPIEGQQSGGDMESLQKLAAAVVLAMIGHLRGRFHDLSSLNGTRLYKQSLYPRTAFRRERKFMEWLLSLHNLWKRDPTAPDTLPGVHWGKARKELTSFTTIMSTHHDDLDFHAALKHMLSSDDWKMAYPNIVLVWIAVAVLPLSTVECDCGFSRQNVIKSWLRGNLCDARLSDLMTISLLEYKMEWEELVTMWHGGVKKRRPAKEVVMAQGSRPTKKPKRSDAVKVAKAAAKAAAAAAREAEALAAVEAARVFEEDAAAGLVWRRKGKGKMIAIESDSEEEEEAPVDSDTDSN
ncbi:hypothetical protein CLOM_g7105 [Closterium sp. NIES-68]|nr:hypothetical protein CLOM_g7105 [Closterium sp. NIES-68]